MTLPITRWIFLLNLEGDTWFSWGSRTFSPPYNQYLVPTWPQTPTGLRFLRGPATLWVWLLCEYPAHASWLSWTTWALYRTEYTCTHQWISWGAIMSFRTLSSYQKNGSKLIPLRGSVDPEKKPNQTKRVWFLHRESVGHARDRVADAPILLEPDGGRGRHVI